MSISSGYVTQWGLSQAATFGTALAETVNFTTFEGAPPSVDFGLVEDRSIKHRGQIYADSNDSYSTYYGGLRVISFSDVFVRVADVAELLYAVTQNVTEAATTPYQKDFDISSTYTCPDFSADAGYFADIGIKDTLTGYHQHFPSCILRTLTLKYTEGDGRLMASGEWISGFVPNVEQTFATGTWGFNTQAYFDFSAPTNKTIATNNVIQSGWEVTFNNNAGRVGNTSTGSAENYKLAIPEFEITGTQTVIYDTTTDSFLPDWIAGTPRAIRHTAGTEDATGYLDLQFPTAEFTGADMDFTNENGRMVTLPWKAMGNTTGSDLFNGEVSDGVDQAW